MRASQSANGWSGDQGVHDWLRRTNSLRVNVRPHAPGTSTTTSRTCWRAIPKTMSAASTSDPARVLLRWPAMAAPSGPRAANASSTMGHPASRSPADQIGPSTPRSASSDRRIASAMGDRHWLAVHTKRTLMSEQCSDDVGDRQLSPNHVSVYWDNEWDDDVSMMFDGCFGDPKGGRTCLLYTSP